MEERRGVSLELALGGAQQEQPAKMHDLGLDGFFFRSADAREVVQFRGDGFTFNRLTPYSSWDDIRPKAIRLFAMYLEVSRPLSVTRTATRYINRLAFPNSRLSDYLTRQPSRAPGTDGTLLGFLDAVIVKESSGATVSFSQRLERADGPDGVTAVVLDVDAFKEGRLDASTAAVEPALELLHDLKNRVFFGSITETAAGLFE
jgi:uncharacterized protein (TIGR04255 family)